MYPSSASTASATPSSGPRPGSQAYPSFPNSTSNPDFSTFSPISAVSSSFSPTSASSSSSSSNAEKIRLAENAKEREQFDNMADLYSILVTTERLEKAFIKDSIKPDEYTNQCSKLISRFKALQTVIKDYVPDINQFVADYQISCAAAVNRLITIGVPATVEFGDSKDMNAAVVAETVAYFITVMDSLKLDLRDVDQVQPLLNDLFNALNKCALPDFTDKEKIKNWLTQLNQMRASDKLDEEQIRQMLYDLDTAYSSFHKLLTKK